MAVDNWFGMLNRKVPRDVDVVFTLVCTRLMVDARRFLILSPGALPEWLGELEGLEELDLYNNSFRGEQWVGVSWCTSMNCARAFCLEP